MLYQKARKTGFHSKNSFTSTMALCFYFSFLHHKEVHLQKIQNVHVLAKSYRRGLSPAYLKTTGAAIKRSRAASAITVVKDNTHASIIYSKH